MSIAFFTKKHFLLLFALCVLGNSYLVRAQIITTVVGTGTAQGYSGDGGPAPFGELYGPAGMVVDAEGNLFIADEFNNCVRRVDAYGVISTFAGTGVAGYSGDGGPAEKAKLHYPKFVTVDAAGNVYISDSRNNRVRKVSRAGIITTYAGDGIGGFSGDKGPATAAGLSNPAGLAFDTAGTLYISDMFNLRVRKVTKDGIITTLTGKGQPGSYGDGGPATLALLDKPYGLATDHAGNVYVADYFNNRVRKIDVKTGIISTYAGGGALFGGFGGDNGPATAATLFNPSDVKFDEADNMYIADSKTYRVRKVDAATGLITTIAGNGVAAHGGDGGSAVDAQFDTPYGLALDSYGDIYVSEGNNVSEGAQSVRYVYTSGITGQQLTVYPNPTFNGQAECIFSSTTEETVKVTVVNMAGRIVISTTAFTNKRLKLNIEPAGLYYIKGASRHRRWAGPLSVAH